MTDLSPAARAILKAFDDRHELLGPFEGNWQEVCLAAALRAAADQVVPPDPCGNDCCITQCEEIRADFLAIATELEGKQ